MAGQATPRGKARAPQRIRRFRVMPLTLTMLVLVLVLKLNAIYFNIQSIREAHAADEAPKADEAKKDEAAKPEEAKKDDEAKPAEEVKKDEAPADTAKADEKKEDAAASKEEPKAEEEAKKDEDKIAGGEKKERDDKDAPVPLGTGTAPELTKVAGTGKMTVGQADALKAKQSGPLYTKDELDLLQNLTKRRQELEQRDQELDLKSKVLEATEKRIDDKLVEMKTMQADLSKVVEAYNAQQNNQLESLVKIYENMKPGDAANIFNEMDMPILLEVISKMSERKVAPVLASMSPKKAKDVTQELAELRRAQAKKIAAAQPAAGQPVAQ